MPKITCGNNRKFPFKAIISDNISHIFMNLKLLSTLEINKSNLYLLVWIYHYQEISTYLDQYHTTFNNIDGYWAIFDNIGQYMTSSYTIFIHYIRILLSTNFLCDPDRHLERYTSSRTSFRSLKINNMSSLLCEMPLFKYYF